MNLIEFVLLISPFVYLLGVAAIVYYWARRTGKYLVPSIFSLLAYIGLVPVYVLLIAVLNGAALATVFESIGLAFLVVALLVVSIFGIIATTLVVLCASGRQVTALICLAVIGVMTMTPVFDDIRFNPVLYVESVLQGEVFVYRGRKIDLGDSYLYYRLEEGFEISKIQPGFAGTEDGYYLGGEPGGPEKMEELKQACADEKSNCERKDHGNYQTIAVTEHSLPDDHSWQLVYYINPQCDAYLTSYGSLSVDRYADFVERFFSESCS